MKQITDYASNIKGIALFARDSLDFRQRYADTMKDDNSKAYELGRINAYANILLLITGRRIATDRKGVEAIINSIR